MCTWIGQIYYGYIVGILIKCVEYERGSDRSAWVSQGTLHREDDV